VAETHLVNVSRKDDLQRKSLKGVTQPANRSATRGLHSVALDAQSLVLARKKLGKELSDGSKPIS